MAGISSYSKPNVPVAVPSLLGELGIDIHKNLTYHDGTAVQILARLTDAAGTAGVPTVVPSGSTYTVATDTQVAMSFIHVDGDLVINGYLVEI